MGHAQFCRAGLAFLAAAMFASLPASTEANEPFKLGIETRQQIDSGSGGYPDYPAYPSYPAPVPQKPTAAPPKKPLQSGVQQNVRPPAPPVQVRPPAPPPQARPPMQASVQQALPPQFLGVWQVSGRRSSVEAQPQYQSAVGSIFAPQTGNTWQIQGNPQAGYTLSSDTGVQTQLYVDKVQGNTAFIRYQHPIKNTMAQEAIVMQLSPDGRQFQGLERISIVKEGEPQPRAKVTYQLTGQRR